MRLEMPDIFDECVCDGEPARRSLGHRGGHVLLSTLAEMKDDDASGTKTLAGLAEDSVIDVKTRLLSFVDEGPWLIAEVGHVPTAKPETHPILEVESRAIEEGWRRDNGVQISHLIWPPRCCVL